MESNNSGETWTDKIRVNDDAINSGAVQDMVWADFNTTGDLLITWRDRRNAPDTGYVTSSEFWAAVKWKDSIDFSPNFKLSDQLVAFDDVLKENGNRHHGGAHRGRAQPWDQRRGGRKEEIHGGHRDQPQDQRTVLCGPQQCRDQQGRGQ